MTLSCVLSSSVSCNDARLLQCMREKNKIPHAQADLTRAKEYLGMFTLCKIEHGDIEVVLRVELRNTQSVLYACHSKGSWRFAFELRSIANYSDDWLVRTKEDLRRAFHFQKSMKKCLTMSFRSEAFCRSGEIQD